VTLGWPQSHATATLAAETFRSPDAHVEAHREQLALVFAVDEG
jgi:hypothetical protein